MSPFPRTPSLVLLALFSLQSQLVTADVHPRQVFLAIDLNNFTMFEDLVDQDTIELEDETPPLEFSRVLNVRERSTGQTALMRCILEGKDDFVELMLNTPSIHYNIPDAQGYTPVHAAGYAGREHIAKMLMSRLKHFNGFDRHHDGFIPMHRACMGEKKRHTRTVYGVLTFKFLCEWYS